ncbi:hypothetical protein ABW19_dt0201850 [Dactylella cylindrospora]|nr:hypothetical protein ABW19_dt0201850 [Dactylella cylindrospora]
MPPQSDPPSYCELGLPDEQCSRICPGVLSLDTVEESLETLAISLVVQIYKLAEYANPIINSTSGHLDQLEELMNLNADIPGSDCLVEACERANDLRLGLRSVQQTLKEEQKVAQGWLSQWLWRICFDERIMMSTDGFVDMTGESRELAETLNEISLAMDMLNGLINNKIERRIKLVEAFINNLPLVDLNDREGEESI